MDPKWIAVDPELFLFRSLRHALHSLLCDPSYHFFARRDTAALYTPLSSSIRFSSSLITYMPVRDRN